MPTDNPSDRLEWNDENFAKVVADIYAEAMTNENLHAQLLSNPVAVLSQRIVVPEAYQGGIFARVRGQQIMMLYVPTSSTMGDQARGATTEADAKPNYEIICTAPPPW